MNDARALAFQLDQAPLLLPLWNLAPGYIAETVQDWKSEEWPVETISLAATVRTEPRP